MAGVKFSNKASDDDHPYGHERIECIAAILLAIILTIIALLIGYSGYEKIVGDPAELEVPGQLALWAAIISIVAKEAMFWYTRNAAQKSILAP